MITYSSKRNIAITYAHSGFFFDCRNQIRGDVAGNIKYLMTLCADKMVMFVGLVIKVSHVFQTFDFLYYSFLRQSVEISVNGCKTDGRFLTADKLIELFGGRVDGIFPQSF